MYKIQPKLLLTLILSFFTFSLFAQDSTKVKWQATANKISEKAYEISFKGNIASGWHLYQANPEMEITGVQSMLDTSAIKGSKMETLSTPQSIQDVIFEVPLQVLKDSGSFKQTLTFLGDVPGSIKLKINYFLGKDDNFIPEESTLTINFEGGVVASAATDRIVIPFTISKALSAVISSKGLKEGLFFFISSSHSSKCLLKDCI